MKTFHPRNSVYVPASHPHPLNTQYKVSIGVEMWGCNPVEVIKIQMVYDGKVEGRKSPSYPASTDDFKNVNDAIVSLINK